MNNTVYNGCEPSIVHELPHRIRLRNRRFHDTAFDAAYFEAILRNIPGVDHVRFNLKTGSVVVGYNGDAHTRKTILKTIATIPEDVYRPMGTTDDMPDPVGTLIKALLAIMAPAFPRSLRAAIAWGMGLPVLAKGIHSLVTRGVTVDVLDASAIGFSLWRRDFFTTDAVVALLGLGEYLERTSQEKTTDLLKTLLRPQVEAVWVVRDGREMRIQPQAVVIGDRVVCGTGEMIPVDGIVLEGDASVNQCAITGEAIPVHLRRGSEAVSGSVIESGRLIIDARQVGNETNLARISRFLQNALRFKSPSEKQSDILADRLVPATFATGLTLFLLTRDVRRAAAVLTVDYSCAIKLANPVAVQTAMYRAAHKGVLLKGGQAMDSLSKVDTVVFDKTGTLTSGRLEVTDLVPVNGMAPDRLLALVAAAEAHYTHPVARAVVDEARRRGLSLPATGRVDFIVAHGVSAYVDGDQILVGSHHFVGEDEGIDCRVAENRARLLRNAGKSLLYVAREGRLEGLVALRDALRPEAPSVLKMLKTQGIRNLIMLTGDHADTARAVAAELSVLDDVHWDLKPEDKAMIIQRLKSDGHVVAFAGDGVNDAPALVSAEVGICMPGGADLAREAAQVVLIDDDLYGLVAARQVAMRTKRVLGHCFCATVGLNTLFLILAASGRLAPVTAAILHNANTIGILGYAALAGLHAPTSDRTKARFPKDRVLDKATPVKDV